MDDMPLVRVRLGCSSRKRLLTPPAAGTDSLQVREGRPKALAGLELPHQGSQFLAAESFGEASIELDLSFISWQGTSEAHTS